MLKQEALSEFCYTTIQNDQLPEWHRMKSIQMASFYLRAVSPNIYLGIMSKTFEIYLFWRKVYNVEASSQGTVIRLLRFTPPRKVRIVTKKPP